MIWLIIGSALVLPLGWLVRGVYLIGRVSDGPKVEGRTGAALLLIDLQTVFWDDAIYPKEDLVRVENLIKAEAKKARAQGWPVIALRQEWSIPSTRVVAKLAMGGKGLAGSDGTELAAPFAPLPDHIIVKRVQDGFETGALDTLLAKLDIGHLRIAGLDGSYCVAQTARAARRRGLSVEILENGILNAQPAKFLTQKKDLAALDVAFV